jgi:hypothetical protein
MTAKKTEAKQAVAKDAPQNDAPVVARLRLNRGSTRRIVRAMEAYKAASEAFIKEIDLQFFEADENGERVAPWAFVLEFQEVHSKAVGIVAGQLAPPEPDEADGE